MSEVRIRWSSEEGKELLKKCNDYFVGCDVVPYDAPMLYEVYASKTDFESEYGVATSFDEAVDGGTGAIIDGKYIFFMEVNWDDENNRAYQIR